MKRILTILFITFLLFGSPIKAAEFVPNVHSTAYEPGHILTTNNSLGLYWITVTWNTQAARWLVIYDDVTIPADGALTAAKVLYCAVVSSATDPAQGSKSYDWSNHPLVHGTTGMVAFLSTNSGGCTTKTADGNNNWITAGIN